MRALIPSIVRTLTPIIVGWLVTLPVIGAAGITSEQVAGLLTAALGAAYYVVIRVVEQRFPQLGWLLGLPTQPVYEARHRA